MNWNAIITELQKHYTLEVLANLAGFASKGHLHDLKMGHQATCSFERGQRLLELYLEKTTDTSKRKD